jgi:hypothetical protein
MGLYRISLADLYSSFQSILLKNSKDQVSKLEQELNHGELTPLKGILADR